MDKESYGYDDVEEEDLNFVLNEIPNPDRPCSECIHAEWVHHYDDIDKDVYGCKKFNVYDDDARFFGKCGLEGKFFEKKL